MTFKTLAIDGGLDLVTAPQAVEPGRLIACSNYEVARQRGIRSIDGYELFDGGASPSYYNLINVTGTITAGINFASRIVVGQVMVLFQTQANNTAGICTALQIIATNNSYNSGTHVNTINVTGFVILSVPVSILSPSFILKPIPAFGSYYQFGVPQVPVTSDTNSVTVSIAPPQSTVSADLTQRQTYYNAIVPTIQPVPGQGNVNGLFWLKNILYATRDYFAVAFASGTTQPNIGDVLYQGASFGSATWTGQVQKIVLTSGTNWSDALTTGNAAGTMTFYNTTGTMTLTTLNNNTQSVTAMAAVSSFGSSVPSPSAGLYWASGQRGTGTSASWQWCDIGWTIQYNNGVLDFVDMNLALTTFSSLSSQYVTTAWKTATTGTQGGWSASGGSFPGVLTAAGDSQYLYQYFKGAGAYNPTPQPFTLTGFGFTDSDIPINASIVGIEIQMTSGAVAITGNTGPVVDGTFSLVGVLNGATPTIANTTTPYTLTTTATSVIFPQYANYVFSLRDTGAPTTASAPTNLLGYYGILPSDVKRSTFGITYAPKTTNAAAQQIQFGVDQVRMRVAYLPQTNGIYFWNGVTHTDGAMTASSTTLAATTSTPFSSSDVGKTISVNGAGAAGAKLVTTIASFTDSGHVVLATAASTTVSGATFNYGTAIQANVVQHYKQSGVVASSNAAGTLYFNFIQNGVVGGIPARPIGSGEQIRTYPTNGSTPDGGALDGSLLIANTSSAMDMNQMDASATLVGAPQPDGSTAPASKYKSVTKNFYASSGLEAIYGVSGGGPAFYFDGIKTNNASGAIVPGNFSRILTGLPLQFETPRSIVYHQGHIVLGYYSGVIQWSNGTNVLSFDPTLYDQTAGDEGFGERVTGMASVNGDTLAVWTKSTIQMVQGNLNIPSGSATVPALYSSTLSPTSGGIEYTIQPMANYTYADFRGVTQLGATQKYGDFEIGHVSADVAPFLIPRLQLSSFYESVNTGVINSVLKRNKNLVQYFFADGTAMSMTYLADGENPQFTIQNYTNASGAALTWDVIEAFTETLGRDRIFGATADGTGNVFEMDRGNSFNGANIVATATLVPDTAQVAYQNKKFIGVNVFGQAQDYATFNVSRSAEYAAPTQGTGLNVNSGTFGSLTATVTGNIAPWRAITTAQLGIEGSAINLRFDSSSNQNFSYTIQAISYDVEPLQQKTQ